MKKRFKLFATLGLGMSLFNAPMVQAEGEVPTYSEISKRAVESSFNQIQTLDATGDFVFNAILKTPEGQESQISVSGAGSLLFDALKLNFSAQGSGEYKIASSGSESSGKASVAAVILDNMAYLLTPTEGWQTKEIPADARDEMRKGVEDVYKEYKENQAEYDAKFKKYEPLIDDLFDVKEEGRYYTVTFKENLDVAAYMEKNKALIEDFKAELKASAVADGQSKEALDRAYRQIDELFTSENIENFLKNTTISAEMAFHKETFLPSRLALLVKVDIAKLVEMPSDQVTPETVLFTYDILINKVNEPVEITAPDMTTKTAN